MPAPAPDHLEWVAFEDDDEDRTWVFDLTFLLSRYRCIYGCGCQGIDDEPAPEKAIGCCSFGAHWSDAADRERVEALAARLGPDEWQHRDVGLALGVTETEGDGGTRTRVHDGACVLLNRPGFGAGPGCALHAAALARGERPMDWKPEVCWQVPVRRVDSTDEVGHVTSTVREWRRRDWGEGGEDFGWWCTEAPEAFTGQVPLIVGMHDELVALVGAPVLDKLVAILAARTPGVPVPHPTVRRARRDAGARTREA